MMTLDDLEDRLISDPDDYSALQILRELAPRHPLCYEEPFPVETHGYDPSPSLKRVLQPEDAPRYFGMKGELFWEEELAGQKLVLQYQGGDLVAAHALCPDLGPLEGRQVTSNAVMLSLPPVVLSGKFLATVPAEADLFAVKRADAAPLAGFFPTVSHLNEVAFEDRALELTYLQSHYFKVPRHGRIHPTDVPDFFKQYHELTLNEGINATGLILHSGSTSVILRFGPDKEYYNAPKDEDSARPLREGPRIRGSIPEENGSV